MMVVTRSLLCSTARHSYVCLQNPQRHNDVVPYSVHYCVAPWVVVATAAMVMVITVGVAVTREVALPGRGDAMTVCVVTKQRCARSMTLVPTQPLVRCVVRLHLGSSAGGIGAGREHRW